MHVGQCWHRPAIDHRQQMFSYFPRSPHPASHISLISTAHLVSTSNRESGSSGLKNIDINCSLGCQDRNRNWNKTINWLAALSVNSIWWSPWQRQMQISCINYQTSAPRPSIHYGRTLTQTFEVSDNASLSGFPFNILHSYLRLNIPLLAKRFTVNLFISSSMIFSRRLFWATTFRFFSLTYWAQLSISP